MTKAQQENRNRFKAVQAEAKKLKAKNPRLKHIQAVKQAWAIMLRKKPKKVAGIRESSQLRKQLAKQKIRLPHGYSTVKRKSISGNETDMHFWIRMFGPRTKAWQRKTFSKLTKEVKLGTINPFSTEAERRSQIEALKILLGKF